MGLVCDVRDESSCAAVVADAVAALGGLDALVYATAIDDVVRATEADGARWRRTFETNVIGAGLVTGAALSHLREARGRAVYISASSVPRPLPGMGIYASSKAALETLVTVLQTEHPDICFTNVRIGSALPTGVYETWDRELIGELSPVWNQLGYTRDNGPGGAMKVEEAVSAILAVLTSPVWLRDVTAVSDPGRENYRF